MSLATHCIPWDEDCTLCNPPRHRNPDDAWPVSDSNNDTQRLNAMEYYRLSVTIKTFASDGVDYYSIAGEGGRQHGFGLTLRMALDDALKQFPPVPSSV